MSEDTKESESAFFSKKEVVSFVLAIAIMMLHDQAFANYNPTRKNIIINYLLSDSFVKIAVPLFFILSGYSFFRSYKGNYKDKIKRRVWSLIVPYLIWNTIWMLYNMVISHTFLVRYFIGREIAEVNMKNIIEGIFHYKYAGVNWYIFALIIFSFLAPVWDILSKNKRVCLITLIVLYGVCNCSKLTVWTSSFLFDYTSIIYYFIGVILGKYYTNNFEQRCSLKASFRALGLGVIALGCRSYLDFKAINNSYYDTFILMIT